MADEDGAAFCLDVLVSVTLRVRDRSRLLLPHTYGYLRAIVQSAKTPTPLVERAVFELLRVCRQTLPGLDVENDAGDAALAEDLLDATRLTFALEPAVADALIARVAHELEALVEALETDDWRAGRLAAERIRTARGWDTVCKLLTATARHPDAAARGFEALARVVAGAPKKIARRRPAFANRRTRRTRRTRPKKQKRPSSRLIGATRARGTCGRASRRRARSWTRTRAGTSGPRARSRFSAASRRPSANGGAAANATAARSPSRRR